MNEDTAESLPDRVRRLLDMSKMTPADLARLINVNPNTIYALLEGRQMWKEFHLNRLSKAFPKVNLHWLITGKGNPEIDAQL